MRRVIAIALLLLVAPLGCGLMFGLAGGVAQGQEAKPKSDPIVVLKKIEGKGDVPVIKNYTIANKDVLVAFRESNMYTTLNLYDDVVAFDKFSVNELKRFIASKDICEIQPADRVRVYETFGHRPNYNPNIPNDALLVEVIDGKFTGRFFVAARIDFCKISPTYEAEFNRKFHPPTP